jgi:hypothetical protein
VCSPKLFDFLHGPSHIKGKQAISSSQNVKQSLERLKATQARPTHVTQTTFYTPFGTVVPEMENKD